MCYCYILHSESLDRFYTGSTILKPENRLERHLQKFYGNKKFTAKVDDWTIFLTIKCDSIEQAKRIERHIKSMNSKKYIKNLIIYPDIIKRLLEKYS